MSTWSAYHSDSELAAGRAELAIREGMLEEGRDFYRHAAQAEELALSVLPSDKLRTRGITAVSAASLWFMASEYAQAQQVAYAALSTGSLPVFASMQLRDLLQTVWGEEMRARSGVKFLPGDVVVSVRGGEVLYGAAPLDLVLRKVEEIRAIVVRTIEMKLGLPLRTGRAAAEEVRGLFEPWLVQQPAGSYQFGVRVRKPEQAELFEGYSPSVEDVTSTTLDILRASVENPDEALPRIVADRDYQQVFLKLARNLAPTGKSFGELRIASGSSAAAPVVMVQAARDAISRTLRQEFPGERPASSARTIQIRGVLRGLSLNKDWLEVRQGVGEHAKDVQIHDAGDSLDDVIGPMVNRRVVVDAFVKKGGRRFYLRDIQSDE